MNSTVHRLRQLEERRLKRKSQAIQFCLEAIKTHDYSFRFVKIELPMDFLLENFFTTHDPEFKKWIETRTSWVEYHKKQLMDLLQP